MTKQEEWKIYREKLLSSLKSLGWAFGISVLFFLTEFSRLRPGEYMQYFLLNLMYGLVIFAWIWTLNVVFWALVIHFDIVPRRTKARLRWSFQLTLGVFGTISGFVTARWIQAKILDHAFSLSGMTQSILYGLFIAMMFQFYYAYKDSKKENLQLEAAKTEAELHVLKNQMQPHFLFNSLNSLSELIAANHSDAGVMTQNLSDLYREILENSKKQLVTVQSELSIIGKYLALEKIRFGGRLDFEIDYTEAASNQAVFIPSLMLQTLVENAVKHGISKDPRGGKVKIKIKKANHGYIAEIHNTGHPIDVKVGGKGTGIENTRLRLERLYGDRHDFRLNKLDDRSTLVRFWFSGAEQNV